ncbi:uncharacterized protein LOC106094385 [Stomoxys calcitrans]|uniref:uncharacterized protein LOC106094385 n=1 Tax=Stomoxys calcitrans TaxID=35570 RepID=UPI0027E2472F|nr:uncharacterized protein LOC106094385 [Stomoxys calcitrans]
MMELAHKVSTECHSWTHDESMTHDSIKLHSVKYCSLYPKNELDCSMTKFENCKTNIYTKYDYYLEKYVHEIILLLDDLFKGHHKLTEKEILYQNTLIDDIWVNSQKHLMVTESSNCVKIYPEIVSLPAKKRFLTKIRSNILKIHASNCYMATSLQVISKTIDELKRRCDSLDYSVESPFLSGTYYLRPLSYFLNLINDLYLYFHEHLCKLQRWAELLDPADRLAIEDYCALIKPNKDYQNNLLEYVDHCCCWRSKRKRCIEEHVPC